MRCRANGRTGRPPPGWSGAAVGVSGADPCRVALDLSDPGAKCTCPSRKFGLALPPRRGDALIAELGKLVILSRVWNGGDAVPEVWCEVAAAEPREALPADPAAPHRPVRGAGDPERGPRDGLHGLLAQAQAAIAVAEPDTGPRAGPGKSAPRVARWLGDIRDYFPARVVQVVQKDAFDRPGLKQMLLQPELLETVEADVHLVADLVALRAAMPERTVDTARMVIRKVVDELMARLEPRTAQAVRGALANSRRSHRPRLAEIDWPRTIAANLCHDLPDLRSVIPRKPVGFRRRNRRLADLDEVRSASINPARWRPRWSIPRSSPPSWHPSRRWRPGWSVSTPPGWI